MPSTHRVTSVKTTRHAERHGFTLDAPAEGATGPDPLILRFRAEGPVVVQRGGQRHVETTEAGAFEIAVDLIGLRPKVGISVLTLEGDRLCHIEARRDIEVATDEPTSAPLGITSLGRSGSTLLMKALGAHPDIAVAGDYPHEARVVAYALLRRKLAVERSNFGDTRIAVAVPPFESLDAAHPKSGESPSGPPTPFELPSVDAATRDYVTDAYSRLCGGRRRFVAEKGIPILQAREVFPDTREILLVRDFRDVLASALAFNAKRGFDDFGRQLVDTDEEFVEVVATRARNLARVWSQDRRPVELVRYEDLVADTSGTLATLLENLDLDPSPAAAMAAAATDQTVQARHGTSSDAAASVAKWRRELRDDLADLATEAMHESLATFGYSTGVAP